MLWGKLTTGLDIVGWILAVEGDKILLIFNALMGRFKVISGCVN